jgi:DNA-binding GntR family transcriptional regulator
MRKSSGPGFLYRDVAAQLREQITNGQLKRGERIPSEAVLTKKFGVSTITVRRAIMELVFDGLLYGRQGLGIFVSDRRKIVRVLTEVAAVSMGDEIRRAGLAPSIRELSYSRVVATDDLAKRFGLRRGATVHCHRKLICADNSPITLDTVFFDDGLAARLGDKLGREFLFPLLKQQGMKIVGADFRFEGSSASEEEASILNLPNRFPLILVQYSLFDARNKIILEGQSAARSDRMVFDLRTEFSRSFKTRPLSKKSKTSR